MGLGWWLVDRLADGQPALSEGQGAAGGGCSGGLSSCELWKGESGRHDQHRGSEQVVGVRLGLVAGLALRARPKVRLERGLLLREGMGPGVAGGLRRKE